MLLFVPVCLLNVAKVAMCLALTMYNTVWRYFTQFCSAFDVYTHVEACVYTMCFLNANIWLI